MTSQARNTYEFGDFRLDPAKRVLLRGEKPVALTPKVFDTLVVLIENRGRTIEKDELMKALWPDSFVEESSLAQNIFQLRKALGEGLSEEAHYIETIPRRGYRFVADVTETLPSGTPKRVPKAEIEQAQGSSRHLSLRSPYLIALLVIVLVPTLYYLIKNVGTEQATNLSEPVRSIAVLPFKPLVSQENDEQLRLGMADALVTKLSSLRELTVRPTSAVLQYTDVRQDPIKAGRDLDVEAVLDGTIQRSGHGIRVTVQLLRVSDGVPLWADKFDEQFTDIFTIQDSISEQVTRALALKLSSDERSKLAKRYTDNTEAYQAYIKGRYFWDKRTEEGLKIGIEHFQKAIELDPTYALAYAGLADSYNMLSYYGNTPPGQNFPQARAAASRALELDDTLAEAHASMAYVKMVFEWDWTGAEAAFKKAIELNPNYMTAHLWYAEYLRMMGRHEESIARGELSLSLDPLSVMAHINLGRTYLMARQPDKAIEHFTEALTFEPTNAFAQISLGRAYAEQGKFNEGIAICKKAQQLSDGGAATVVLGYIYSLQGRPEETRKILREMETAARRRYVSPYTLAMLNADIGEKDKAFQWLDRAYDERSEFLVGVKADPRFDYLRSDARFTDLMQRLGFSDLPVTTPKQL
ncbi:MAG TPA: tetratricopeptide repeat protein [Pyrinomonadaceae bacterium]|nr:tetratricopeptide repeat protein [Pyrinomonadaceae bacterium]